MSQDHGRQLVRHLSPVKAASPGLGRPSLFAGMDDDNTVDGDMQRVRILSTLESARRPVRGAPSKMRRDRRTSTFSVSSRVLMALMGIGVLTLMTSFVIVVLNGHDASPKVEAAMQAHVSPPTNDAAAQSTATKTGTTSGRETSSNPLAALIAPPPAAPQPAEPAPQTAVIETVVPPSAQPNVMESQAALSPLTSSTFAVAASTPAKVIHALKPTDEVVARAAPAAPLAKAPPAAVQNKALTEAQAKLAKPAQRPNNAPRRDEDVALLEAMFTHASSSRKTTVSAADELKTRCGKLNGAEAATCRASVCVQNPSASVCHQDP